MGDASDELVHLLCAATGDDRPLAEDVDLARAAGRWLVENGWEPHYRLGFYSNQRDFSFRADENDPALVVVRRKDGMWDHIGDTYRLPDMGAALNFLAVLGIVPGERFSTFGRDALRDHAEACERAADRIETRGANLGGREYDEAASHAEGLRAAASSARQHYPLRVPA